MCDGLLVKNDKRGVCTIALNRPDKHNAFDDKLIKTLIETLTKIEVDKKTRIVILTGEGETFSSGADLNWMQSMVNFTKKKNIDDAAQLAKLMHTLYSLGKPTIAKVNGSAFGGALGLITCCDFAIASTKAMFAFTEVKLGIVPAVISPYIVNAIGSRLANQLFLSAETISIDEAMEFGLIDEAVDIKFLDKTVAAYVDQLLVGGPEAQKECKKLTRKLNNIPDNIQKYTTELIASIRTSKEGQEGLNAFLEKRKPKWNK